MLPRVAPLTSRFPQNALLLPVRPAAAGLGGVCVGDPSTRLQFVLSSTSKMHTTLMIRFAPDNVDIMPRSLSTLPHR